MLASRPREVVTRSAIMEQIWDGSWPSRTLDTHVNTLRRKLGGGEWIATVRGIGFRFVGDGAMKTAGVRGEDRDYARSGARGRLRAGVGEFAVLDEGLRERREVAFVQALHLVGVELLHLRVQFALAHNRRHFIAPSQVGGGKYVRAPVRSVAPGHGSTSPAPLASVAAPGYMGTRGAGCAVSDTATPKLCT